MYVINRIDVMSAFKVGAVLSALVWAVLGLLLVFVQGAFFSMIFMTPDMMNYGSGASSGFATFSLSILLIMYVCGVVAYAVIGGIMAALSAFLYNVVVRWTGGLKMEMVREHVTFEKFKHSPDDDPFDTFE